VGKATRLSREAPVPVLEFQRQFSLPGAAANPAQNIQSLGSQSLLVGIVGDDDAGRDLLHRLSQLSVDTSGVIVNAGSITTTKTRVLAEGPGRLPQQLVRIDHPSLHPIDEETTNRLIRYLHQKVGSVDAILISDYKGGLISPDILNTVSRLAASTHTPITVDSQGDLLKFKGCTVVKSNQQEAEATLGRRFTDDNSFRQATAYLRETLDAEGVVVTRGSEGLSLAYLEGYYHVPASSPSEVFDVTGAGDTVIAVLTLALAARATLPEAAYLANSAAGLVVRKLGNAVITIPELQAELERQWAWHPL